MALFAGALYYAVELEDVRAEEHQYGTGDPLPAVVDESYRGGPNIPVTYDHALFGPTETSIDLPLRGAGPWPVPGDVIPVRAARGNPFAVRLASSDPDRPPLWVALLFVPPLLVASGRRWWTTRQAQRLVGTAPVAAGAPVGADSGGPGEAPDRTETEAEAGMETGLGGGAAGSQVLLGRIRPRRRRDQTVVLDLFAADAGPQARPLCSVPLISSLGLPLGGPAFPVEVHGQPRRFGRVVARVPDGVLWPRRRALVLPRWLSAAGGSGAAGPRRRGDRVDEAPPRLAHRRLRPPKQIWPNPGGRVLASGALVAAGLAVGVLGTLSVLREADRAEALPEGSVEAAALAVGPRPDGLLAIRVRLPGTGDQGDGGSASDDRPDATGDDGDDGGTGGNGGNGDPAGASGGDGAADRSEAAEAIEAAGGEPDDASDVRDAAVQVPNAAAWPAGAPLVVHIDPDAPLQARLPRGPYRAGEPAVWTWLPAVASVLWLGRTLLWRREVERAAQDERWRPVEIAVDQMGQTTFLISRPGADSPSCLVTVPMSTEHAPEAVGRTVVRGGQVYVHGLPAPGEKLLLRFGGAVMATSVGAAVRDRPWRRRWRTLTRWLQRSRPPLAAR